MSKDYRTIGQILEDGLINENLNMKVPMKTFTDFTRKSALEVAKKAGLKAVRIGKGPKEMLDLTGTEDQYKKFLKMFKFDSVKEELDERAALVMNQTHIIDVVLKDLKEALLKQLNNGKTELVNNVARLVGLKVTTKGQAKNRAYMYDLTKGKK